MNLFGDGKELQKTTQDEWMIMKSVCERIDTEFWNKQGGKRGDNMKNVILKELNIKMITIW